MQGEPPSPAGAAPAIAKGITGVGLAGRAEKTTAAKLEALEPGAYGKEGCRRGTPPKARLGMKSGRCRERARWEVDALPPEG